MDATNISAIADRYVRDYSFMAVNATMENARMMHRVHAEWMIAELKQVHDELIRRGMKVIATKEEYDAGVSQHGIPPAFAVTGEQGLRGLGVN